MYSTLPVLVKGANSSGKNVPFVHIKLKGLFFVASISGQRKLGQQ